MKYFVIEPEVAGGLGPNTIMDRNVHPSIVSRLHYRFDGWLGDALWKVSLVLLPLSKCEKHWMP